MSRHNQRNREVVGEALQPSRVDGRLEAGIAPLADTRFNQSRSNVKLKEYAAGGAMWLVSPVGAYGDMGRREDEFLGAVERVQARMSERRALASR